MANQDDFVKTALRLPRGLHAEIQAAAIAAGRSMNAEIIDRLHAKDATSAAVILERLRDSENALLQSTKKQVDVLWSVVERTRTVLAQMDYQLARVEPSSESATLIQNIEFLRELIDTIKAHR